MTLACFALPAPVLQNTTDTHVCTDTLIRLKLQLYYSVFSRISRGSVESVCKKLLRQDHSPQNKNRYMIGCMVTSSMKRNGLNFASVDFSRPELIVICLSPQYGDLTLCCFGVPISLPALYNRPWSIVDDLP